MIVTCGDPETAIVWEGRQSRRLPPDIQNVALRKLRLLNNARTLDDLRVPPRQQARGAIERPTRSAFDPHQ
jgi:proteic killer suppression protein